VLTVSCCKCRHNIYI